jgi:aminoglycoside phosphotransferase (APT) family kinase protein
LERPWLPDRVVSPELARVLVAEQFPKLAPVVVELCGTGWDNTAYRVDGKWVFRFPRREIAVDLLRREVAVLPALAPSLPLPIPRPTLVGRPDARFPWPFAGYRFLPGRTAEAARLGPAERLAAAPALAGFLRALHAFPVEEARRLGAEPDVHGKLDVERKLPELEERLATAVRLGLLPEAEPWRGIARDVPAVRARRGGGHVLVHGDLYARHLLFGGEDELAGVIDWGDVHVGDPAVDLSVAWSFLPAEARSVFCAEYGAIDPDAWRLARFRAVYVLVAVLSYAADAREWALVREASVGLESVGAG